MDETHEYKSSFIIPVFSPCWQIISYTNETSGYNRIVCSLVFLTIEGILLYPLSTLYRVTYSLRLRAQVSYFLLGKREVLIVTDLYWTLLISMSSFNLPLTTSTILLTLYMTTLFYDSLCVSLIMRNMFTSINCLHQSLIFIDYSCKRENERSHQV